MKNQDEEFFIIISCILESEEFKKRKQYEHHINESVYEHSYKVAYLSYKIAKKLNLDYKSAAIGGLLHDFYEKPWLINGKLAPKVSNKIKDKHGFAHAKNAANNAKAFYPDLIDEKIENIIKRHMFPLNITPPKYKEGWIIVFVDKYVSLTIFKSIKSIPKYI